MEQEARRAQGTEERLVKAAIERPEKEQGSPAPRDRR